MTTTARALEGLHEFFGELCRERSQARPNQSRFGRGPAGVSAADRRAYGYFGSTLSLGSVARTRAPAAAATASVVFPPSASLGSTSFPASTNQPNAPASSAAVQKASTDLTFFLIATMSSDPTPQSCFPMLVPTNAGIGAGVVIKECNRARIRQVLPFRQRGLFRPRAGDHRRADCARAPTEGDDPADRPAKPGRSCAAAARPMDGCASTCKEHDHAVCCGDHGNASSAPWISGNQTQAEGRSRAPSEAVRKAASKTMTSTRLIGDGRRSFVKPRSICLAAMIQQRHRRLLRGEWLTRREGFDDAQRPLQER